MYCSNCGEPLKKGAKSCSQCGAAVEATEQVSFDETANAVMFKLSELWDKLSPKLVKMGKALLIWVNEVWDKFTDELPFRLPKKLTLIAVVVLIVLNAVIGGNSGESFDSNGSGGGGGSIWSSNSSSFSTTSSRNCVFCTDGKVTCTACDGDKGKYVYGSVANYSGSTSPNTTTRTWQSCSKCRGSGKQDCTRCGG